MLDIIHTLTYIPESIPEHSLLYCDFKSAVSCEVETNRLNNIYSRYNVTTIPNDFLTNEEIRFEVLRTIQRIKNYVTTENGIQYAYDEFDTIVKSEMKNKLPTSKE